MCVRERARRERECIWWKKLILYWFGDSLCHVQGTTCGCLQPAVLLMYVGFVVILVKLLAMSCWAFWRFRGPNSMKHGQRKVPTWQPQWNSHECILVAVVVVVVVVVVVKYGYVGCSAPCCVKYLQVCWAWVLACDSERIGRCGRSPTNSTRNLTSIPVFNTNINIYMT